MRGMSVVIANSVIALAAASPATGSTVYLTSVSSAGACGGSVGCQSQDNKTLDPATKSDILSTSISSTIGPGDGSYANSSSASSFGSLHVYADAFRTLVQNIGDAQSRGYAEFSDVIPATNINGSYNFTFAISGSHTPTDGVAGASAYGFLYYDVVDTKTNTGLGNGTWSSSDLNPTTTIVKDISVPVGDGISLRVSFEADAYTMNNNGAPFLVVADYSHTLNVYVDPAASGADVVGLSGHDYATPSVGAVPELSTWAMMLLGFAGLGFMAYRRKSKPVPREKQMHFRGIVSAAVMLGSLIALSPARADILTGNFLIENQLPSASGGTITFTLNGDGTIAADLVSTAGRIDGFGFNSIGPNRLPELNFSYASTVSSGWGDVYGVQHSGLYVGSGGPTTLTWTIGNVGEFTSVFDALGGNTSSTDFYMRAGTGTYNDWGANAVLTSAVPEPSTWAMMLLGFAGLGFVAYRRKSKPGIDGRLIQRSLSLN